MLSSSGRSRGRRLAAATLVATSLHLAAFAPLAQAQQAYGAGQSGADAVVLKDGGVIRGTLTEMIPGDHATVLLSTGQAATIRWDVIARIERNGAPVQAAPATPAPATTAPATAPAVAAPAPVPSGPEGNAHVHIDADPDVRLEQQSDKSWAAVCSAPCDRDLPLNATYRINGSGIRPSHGFRLMASKPGDRVLISVDPSSQGGFVGGIILTSIGAPVAVIGGLILLVGLAIDAAPDATGNRPSTTGLKIGGGTALGLGLVGVIAGVVLIMNNARTGVDQFNDTAKQARRALGDVATRTPTWHDATGPAPTTPALSVPLFTGHF